MLRTVNSRFSAKEFLICARRLFTISFALSSGSHCARGLYALEQRRALRLSTGRAIDRVRTITETVRDLHRKRLYLNNLVVPGQSRLRSCISVESPTWIS